MTTESEAVAAPGDAHARFIQQLRNNVKDWCRRAAQAEIDADLARGTAEEAQRYFEETAAEADRWQRQLDFAVLSDSNKELAHAFATAVYYRNAGVRAKGDGVQQDAAEVQANEQPRDENGVCQFNEDDQHPEKENGEAAHSTPTVYTQAQLDGDDCALCGHALAPGQGAGEHGEHDGEPLLAHLSCIETAESEA